MEDESKTAFKLQYCLIVKKISHLDGYTSETDQQQTEYLWKSADHSLDSTHVNCNNCRK